MPVSIQKSLGPRPAVRWGIVVIVVCAAVGRRGSRHQLRRVVSEASMREVLEGNKSGRRVRVERGIYRQANGKYVVCFMLDGKPRFRTVGRDLELARAQRLSLVRAARFGMVAAAPRLRLETVAGWWLERYKRRVASGERRVRTLEIHSYYLNRHVLPLIGSRLIREVSVADVADLLDLLRERGYADKTAAGALGTLGNVMRFAVRNSWIAESPVEKLERRERPRLTRHPQRALGRDEIARLLDCCLPAYRTLVATALYTGMRLSELLGLVWDDVDFASSSIHVRAQLSRAHARVAGTAGSAQDAWRTPSDSAHAAARRAAARAATGRGSRRRRRLGVRDAQRHIAQSAQHPAKRAAPRR